MNLTKTKYETTTQPQEVVKLMTGSNFMNKITKEQAELHSKKCNGFIGFYIHCDSVRLMCDSCKQELLCVNYQEFTKGFSEEKLDELDLLNKNNTTLKGCKAKGE